MTTTGRNHEWSWGEAEENTDRLELPYKRRVVFDLHEVIFVVPVNGHVVLRFENFAVMNP